MIHLGNLDHGQALGDRSGAIFIPRLHGVISITLAGNLLGGVTYTDYTHRVISMHAAAWSPWWLTRDMLWTIFTYPFDNLKVERCIAPVASTNVRSLKLCYGLGFVLHATIPEIVPGGDLVILSMRREDCRWLNWRPRYLKTETRDGQKQRPCST